MGKKRGAGEPKGIADILDVIRQSEEYGQHFELAKIWRHWPDIAGPKLMPHGRPVGIRDDTLYLEIESSVWMHRFSYYKWDILHRINQLTPKAAIAELFFVLTKDDPDADPQDNV